MSYYSRRRGNSLMRSVKRFIGRNSRYWRRY